ncbi:MULTISPECIES: hypothetical protein [unclassified Acinetobacter]|uniref:hypothetical protein n=1 Tax=unclassified Acinetobacter TaxID=196816 RepID=UPI00124BF813|nr:MULTISPECIES: hypothetical protein [unclassified Acinetobacter]
MTQVQQTPEIKKRGPKPKNASTSSDAKNTETQSKIEEKTTEQSTAVNTSSQTELQTPTQSQVDPALGQVNAQDNVSSNGNPEISGDQNQSTNTANSEVNSAPEIESSLHSQNDVQAGIVNQNQSGDTATESLNSGPETDHALQQQNEEQGDKVNQIQSTDEQTKIEQSKNNENIVVQVIDKAKEKPIQDLILKVKNEGLKAVYEPHSKTSIEPGEVLTIIQCANRADLKSVLANIDQLNALGKKIKVVNDE